MADTANFPDNRYWCYTCNAEVELTRPSAGSGTTEMATDSDYTCSQCSGGFIELMTEDDGPYHDANDDSVEIDNNHPSAHLLSVFNNVFGTAFSNRGNNRGPVSGSFTITPNGVPVRLRTEGGGPGTEQHIHNIDPNTDPAHQILQLLMPQLGGIFGHLNEGEDFDAIVSQLLNQYEGAGAPPASTDQLKQVKDDVINEEEVGKELQCPVCMDFYSLNEAVKSLPQCSHKFHNDCIMPWLEQHGTCPICRKDMKGKVYTGKVDYSEESSSNAAANATSSNQSQSSVDNNNSGATIRNAPRPSSNTRRAGPRTTVLTAPQVLSFLGSGTSERGTSRSATTRGGRGGSSRQRGSGSRQEGRERDSSSSDRPKDYGFEDLD